MLDIRLIRKDPEGIQQRLRTKVQDADVSKALSLDESIRSKKTAVEQLKAQRNDASETIGHMKREGKDCAQLMQDVAVMAEQIHQLDHQIAELEPALIDELARLPNLPYE